MDEGNDSPEGHNEFPEGTEEPTEREEVTLSGFEAFIAEEVEHQGTISEAILESNMRVYDSILALITVISGDRRIADGLRAQHKEGTYYFPPFALSRIDKDDDPEESHEYEE